MKKRKRLTITILSSILAFAFFFIPKYAHAEVTQVLDGVELASPGESISYQIKVTSKDTMIEYSTSLIYDSTVLELVSISNQNNWQGANPTGASPLSLKFNHTGTSGESVIATITFRVKQSPTKVNATLSLQNSNAKIKTTAADGSESEGMLVAADVTKNFAIKSTDNYLKSLSVNGKSVNNFKTTTYNYVMQVESDVTVAKINAVPNHAGATFVKDFGNRDVPLEYGENEILVKVLSQAGEERVYTILITRVDNRESNNFLKDIIINGGKIKIDFNRNINSYRIKTYGLETITIDATTEDAKATYEITKPDTLIIGENTITIKVLSESKVERIYKVIIDNTDEKVDTTLKNLSIEGYHIDFAKNIYDYEIRYDSKYKDGLVIRKNSTLNSDDGVYIDESLLEQTNKDLKVGSVIKIRVYYDDENESTYTITIVKDTRLNFFFVLGLCVLIILVVIVIVLYTKKKKQKQVVEETIEELEKTKEMKLN